MQCLKDITGIVVVSSLPAINPDFAAVPACHGMDPLTTLSSKAPLALIVARTPVLSFTPLTASANCCSCLRLRCRSGQGADADRPIAVAAINGMSPSAMAVRSVTSTATAVTFANADVSTTDEKSKAVVAIRHLAIRGYLRLTLPQIAILEIAAYGGLFD